MKLILKILLAPALLAMMMVYLFLTYVLSLSTALLHVLSTALGIVGFVILFFDVSAGLMALVLAWFCSPVGLPLFAGWLIGLLEVMRIGIWGWLCE